MFKYKRGTEKKEHKYVVVQKCFDIVEKNETKKRAQRQRENRTKAKEKKTHS